MINYQFNTGSDYAAFVSLLDFFRHRCGKTGMGLTWGTADFAGSGQVIYIGDCGFEEFTEEEREAFLAASCIWMIS
jgi:hypothetical protein